MISTDEFRLGMQQLAATVNLVTSEHRGERCGMTATAVCSLSAEPPRLLVSVNRGGRTCETISASRTLCVNILAGEQEALAALFAAPAPDADRFAGGDWTTLATGAPVLETAVAAFDCRVVSIIDTGSHCVVIADIIASRTDTDRQPLLYLRGRFMHLPAA